MGVLSKVVRVVVSPVGMASACSVGAVILYMLLKNKKTNERVEPKSSKITVMKMDVPRIFVSAIIGRKGDNIRYLEEKTATEISFSSVDDTSKHRICSIKGEQEQCLNAMQMIHEIIQLEKTVEKIPVPSHACGYIIGSRGARIRETRQRSRTKIHVEPGTEKQEYKDIIIQGSPDNISTAISMIVEQVQESELLRKTLTESERRRAPRGNSHSPLGRKFIDEGKVTPSGDLSFDVYVCAFTDVSNFWVQIRDSNCIDLDKLVQEMTDYYNSETAQGDHVTKAKIGDIVAAPFRDDKWYRACVTDTSRDESGNTLLALHYVDYGDTAVLPAVDVRELRIDFLQLHFQAMLCELAYVKPSDGTDTWSEEANNLFSELAHVSEWTAVILRFVGVKEKEHPGGRMATTCTVELVNTSNKEDVNVADALVEQGFAIRSTQGACGTSKS